MTSYIFNSKSVNYSRLSVVGLWTLSIILFLLGFLAVEASIRLKDRHSAAGASSMSGAELVAALPDMFISGREIGNQAIAQNVALFEKYPAPAEITEAFTGTSRTKVLRPSLFGQEHVIVGAGNSYNEITYGLLLQAEILRLRFPNLRTMFVESSLLTRRPGRLIVEADHLKYLPLLRSMAPLCDAQDETPGCVEVFKQLKTFRADSKPFWRSELLAQRSNLRVSNLIGVGREGIRVRDDPLLAKLSLNGEQRASLAKLRSPSDFVAETTQDNPKVQRLRDILSNTPWDGLYDMVAKWGKAHGIQVVFYQPPVRSDLFAFQQRFGLQAHVDDLHRVSEKFHVPFIDLDAPAYGYMNDWTLFSDEDHLGTCVGSGLLYKAIQLGYEKFLADGTLFPVIDRSRLPANGTMPSCAQ